MFLNNSQAKYKICNGTIGVITDVDVENMTVRVAFSVHSGIVDMDIKKQTSNFLVNGIPASRVQFPIQNAFALTVHKTQSLTLPDVSLSLDSQIFALNGKMLKLMHFQVKRSLLINR